MQSAQSFHKSATLSLQRERGIVVSESHVSPGHILRDGTTSGGGGGDFDARNFGTSKAGGHWVRKKLGEAFALPSLEQELHCTSQVVGHARK